MQITHALGSVLEVRLLNPPLLKIIAMYNDHKLRNGGFISSYKQGWRYNFLANVSPLHAPRHSQDSWDVNAVIHHHRASLSLKYQVARLNCKTSQQQWMFCPFWNSESLQKLKTKKGILPNYILVGAMQQDLKRVKIYCHFSVAVQVRQTQTTTWFLYQHSIWAVLTTGMWKQT